LEGQYTNKQLANFNLELLRASDRLLDVIPNRFLKIIVGLGLLIVNEQAGTALHEVGHGLRWKSYGLDYELMLNSNEHSSFKKNENFFKYFLENLFNNNRAACESNETQLDNLQTSLDKISFYNFDIIVSAGGINNNTYIAEKISDDILYKNSSGRLLPYLVYLENMLYGANYDKSAKETGEDPYDIIYDFNVKGRDDFKKGVIRDAGIKSLFLSGTTYSFFYTLITKKTMIKPFGFRIPDVFPYITTKGMSYKVVSGYEVNKNLNLIFGFEKVFTVEEATEYSLGIDHIMKITQNFPISYRSIVTFGEGLDLEASCSVPLTEHFSVGLGLEIYDVKSLQGQRHAMTNMKEGRGSSNSFFATVSYRY
jgi:hypothetical protein